VPIRVASQIISLAVQRLGDQLPAAREPTTRRPAAAHEASNARRATATHVGTGSMRRPVSCIALLAGTRVPTHTHARRVYDRKEDLLLRTWVRARVTLAEEAVALVIVNAERADYYRLCTAGCTRPLKRKIASENPNGASARGALARAEDFPLQNGGVTKVVFVLEAKPLRVEHRANLGAHARLSVAEVKRAHVAATFKPDPTKKSIQLLESRVLPRLDLKPVP
jgi:hypothetical protein